MNAQIIRECEVVKKYIKKDGSISEHKYKIKYMLADRTNKVTRKQLIEKIKNIKKDDLKKIDDFLNNLLYSSELEIKA